jgi:hypothetical protein
MSDPYFSNVTLLLHCDGADGSTTFTDVKGHTVTPAGNAQIDTAQSKFGGASAFLDGSGDYVSVADSADWDLPGAFTAELWCRGNTDANGTILNLTASNNAGLSIGFSASNGRVYFYIGLDYVQTAASFGSVLDGSWHHIVLQRDVNNLCTLFFDGVSAATRTKSYSVTSTGIAIGPHYTTNPNKDLWVDEVRITKGVARYTANFTPPTAAFADAAPTTYDPFFDNVTLLLHCDGSDGSTTFTDVKGHTFTANGNAQIDTAQSKFGGASGLFDGSGDYLTVGDSSDWDLPGDFTLECWVRPSNVTGVKSVIGFPNFSTSWLGLNGNKIYTNLNGSGNTGATAITANVWTHLAVVRSGSTVTMYVDGVAQTAAAFTYATGLTPPGLMFGAVSTSGSVWPFAGHIDDLRITKGVARYTANFTPPTVAFLDTGTETAGSTTYTVTTTSGASLQGTLLRAVTSDAYLQSAVLRAVTSDAYLQSLMTLAASASVMLGFADPHYTSVRLLMHFDGEPGTAQFIDECGHILTTNNDLIQHDSSYTRFGSGSLRSDGYTDVITTPYVIDDFDMPGDFTLEVWLKHKIGSPPNNVIVATKYAHQGLVFGRWSLKIRDEDHLPTFVFNKDGAVVDCLLGTTDLRDNQWHHLAVTRADGVFRLFVDGIQEGSEYTDDITLTGGQTLAFCGAPSVSGSFCGWLDDFRFTNGVARYTEAFTPPVAAYWDAKTARVNALLQKRMTLTTTANFYVGGESSSLTVAAGPAELGLRQTMTVGCDFVPLGMEFVAVSSAIQKALSKASTTSCYIVREGLTLTSAVDAQFSQFKRCYMNSAVRGAVRKEVRVSGTVQATQAVGCTVSVYVYSTTSRCTLTADACLVTTAGVTAESGAYLAKLRTRAVRVTAAVGATYDRATAVNSVLKRVYTTTLSADLAATATRSATAVPSAVVQSSNIKSLSVGAYLRAAANNPVIATTRIDGEWVALTRPTEWLVDVRNTEFAPDARNAEWVL